MAFALSPSAPQMCIRNNKMREQMLNSKVDKLYDQGEKLDSSKTNFNIELAKTY